MRTIPCASILALVATACVDRNPSPNDLAPDPLSAATLGDRSTGFHLPGPTDDLLALFSGCLTRADFDASNMGPAWRGLATATGSCTSCHGYGEYGFIASSDELLFEAITTDRYYMTQFFAVDEVLGRVVVAEQQLAIVATGVPPYQQHPRFSLDDGGIQALRAWYALANARSDAGTCGPPTLEN